MTKNAWICITFKIDKATIFTHITVTYPKSPRFGHKPFFVKMGNMSFKVALF